MDGFSAACPQRLASFLSCSVLVSVAGFFSGLVYGLGIRSARGDAGMRVQRLVMPDGSGSWTVLDDRGGVIAPVEAFRPFYTIGHAAA